MAKPFFKMPGDLLATTNAVCTNEGGWTTDHGDWLRKPGNTVLVRRFMDERITTESADKAVNQVTTEKGHVTNLIPADGWTNEYTRFYREVFGREVDLAEVEIPPEQPGFDWAVIIMQSLTLNQAWAKCKERFRSYSYFGDDLDSRVPTNDHTSVTAYAKRFRDRVEADEENKNLSAYKLTKQGVKGITLLERLVLELWYHWRTGKHLDVKNVTLCTGSRYSDGDVLRVHWGDDALCVDGYCPAYANDRVRARSAV